MNEQQQELYEKLLKKVNEFCLGQAAEDVIEAIDNLVDTYENPKVDLVSEPLQTLQNIKLKLLRNYDGSICMNGNVMFENEIPVIETALNELKDLKEIYGKVLDENEDYKKKMTAYDYLFGIVKYYIEGKSYTIVDIANSLKALEIIKNKGISTCSVALNYGDDWERYSKSCFRNYNPVTREEYELLKEVLK